MLILFQEGNLMDIGSASNVLMQTPTDAVAMGACDTQGTDAIAKVNGKPIPQGRLEYLMKSSSVQDHADAGESANRVLNMLISQEVLYQEAVRMGYEMNPDVAMQIEINKEEVVIDAYLRDYAIRHPIGEDRLRQEYELQKRLTGDKEYKVRHILVGTEDEAMLAVAELKKGASFDELVAQNSADDGSEFRGGELDWAPAERYVPQFRDALKKLGKGQMTEVPVRTQFGWHIIRVDDERPLELSGIRRRQTENLRESAAPGRRRSYRKAASRSRD